MVNTVRFFPYNHEGLSSITRTYVKPGMIMHICNLSTGMAETERSLGLVASQSNGLSKLQVH